MSNVAVEELPYFPPGMAPPESTPSKACIVVYGRSGVGKSYLIHQMTHDMQWNPAKDRPWLYHPNDIAVWMAEDSTSTYGDPQPAIKRVNSVLQLKDSIEHMIAAAEDGQKMPRIGFIDSISGICDYQMKLYKNEVPFTGKSGLRDKLAEYGDLGSEVIELMLLLRDQVPFDIVCFVTTYEPGGGAMPKLAIPGKMIPENLTRLTSSAFYMKAFGTQVDPAEIIAKGVEKVQAPHRTIGFDGETQKPDGSVVNRYFLTQDHGEVFAKGHKNLALKERAVLTDVLRKIHGVEPPTIGVT